MNKYVVWLHRVTFVGVLINILGMALPFIFAPQWYLDFFGAAGRRRFDRLGRTRGFLPFGFLDCGHAVLNGILLWLAIKHQK